MNNIPLSNGTTVEVRCLSCALTSGLIKPDGGVIIETPLFHAHQDVAYPIPGLVILASKRHVFGLDELTEEESIEYLQLLRRIRKAQREVLKIEHVYYFYNEDTTHHFHTWLVPRYTWMYAFGRSVESVRPVLLHA
ncbi:HIT family protein [Pontibacter toksunensis]|uniref:HIT family protein n=1 Tax=Pontibacter toksunensis TaxID=1332631 RepID=A0ABW6BRV5_9BACT